jgi:hypothetical protein
MREEFFWAELGIDPVRWCEAKYAEWSVKLGRNVKETA